MDSDERATAYGFAETWGWLPHAGLSAAETLHAFGVYGLAFLVVGYLSGALADQLHLADQSIREKEQGLSRLQAFHENIVHSIGSGVFTTDEKGQITSFNPAAQEATGYSFEQVQGCPWQEVFNWHPSQQDDDRMQDVSANMRFEVECKRSDGNRLILGMTLAPLHERGGENGISWNIQGSDTDPRSRRRNAAQRMVGQLGRDVGGDGA